MILELSVCEHVSLMISAVDLIGASKKCSFEPLQVPCVLSLGKAMPHPLGRAFQGNASLWGKWVLSDFETKAFIQRGEAILQVFLSFALAGARLSSCLRRQKH